MRCLLGRGNPFQQMQRRELRRAMLGRIVVTTAVIIVGWLFFKMMVDDTTALILGISVVAALTFVLFVINAISENDFAKPVRMAARSAGMFALGALAAWAIVAAIHIAL
jgi:hypothetical protein